MASAIKELKFHKKALSWIFGRVPDSPFIAV